MRIFAVTYTGPGGVLISPMTGLTMKVGQRYVVTEQDKDLLVRDVSAKFEVSEMPEDPPVPETPEEPATEPEPVMVEAPKEVRKAPRARRQ